MIGRSINNYEIKALIGEGGMGTVYLAEHPFMGRKAAIKLLRKAYHDDEKMVARFMNEARAANAIRHPNIIDIIDVGRMPEPDGIPYLMMEYLEGETLAHRLKRLRPLPVREALDVAAQAAGALAAAHEVGIVHRDLKPQNLFLVVDAAAFRGERVKVLDFGIAKLCVGSTELTSGGNTGAALLGSPMYMSPEQCRGLTSEIDHRTDIYALAALTYEMMCGAPPFVSEAYGDILMMHLSQAPTPLRARNPEVPEHVEAAIMRALSKRADDRFDSMTAFTVALERPTRVHAPSFPPTRASEAITRQMPFGGATPPLVAVNTPAPVVEARSRRTRRLVMLTVAALTVGAFYMVDKDRRVASVDQAAAQALAAAPAPPAPAVAPVPAIATAEATPPPAATAPAATPPSTDAPGAVTERRGLAVRRPARAELPSTRGARRRTFRPTFAARGVSATRGPAERASRPAVAAPAPAPTPAAPETPRPPAEDRRQRWIEKW